MKKIFLVLVLMFVAVIGSTGIAMADWEITASWTASKGTQQPDGSFINDIDHEDLIVGGVVIHTVPAGGQTAWVWTQSLLSGEQVVVKSYNTAGGTNDGYPIGSLSPDSKPAPASGGSIIIQWRP